MLDTTCSLTIYEVDGKEVTPIGGPKLLLRSRDKYRMLVELEIEGKRVSVSIRDLRSALIACEQVGS